MPSSAHCHTAGIGRGHRQGLQQEGGIGRRWQEPPTESGSWKVLALGRIAQHPVGAWPACPPHHPSSPQRASFHSWVVLILGNSQHPLSSIFCGILKAGAYFWGSSYPLCRAETHGDRASCPLQRCCLGAHPMSSITVLGGVGFVRPCQNHPSSVCPTPGRDLEGVLLPPPWGTGTL